MSSVRLDGTSNPFISQPYVSQRDSGQGPSVGTLLANRYRVERLIGRGGFSSVFLAYDNLRGEDVALKAAITPAYNPEIARAVLQHELRMYTRIGCHPRILRVFDLHYIPKGDSGVLLLSMEHAEESLRDRLTEYRDDYATRLALGPEYLEQMCLAVSPVHRAGIVHLDIKPENFFFVGGLLKIADFGAARHIHMIEMNNGNPVPSLGIRIGTPEYMAPELLMATNPRDVHPRADAFSIGVIGFELLSRECRPPCGASYEELQARCRSLIASTGSSKLANVARVLARCLEKV